MALKTKDVEPPQTIFDGFKGFSSPKDILERVKEMQSLEAKYERRAKIAAAQRKQLASSFHSSGRDLAQMLKSLQILMTSLDEYETGVGTAKANISKGVKDGEMHMRRAGEHVKALTNMYKTWEKAEKAGDQKKTEVAAKAYTKARNNAEKDFSPINSWLMSMDTFQKEQDRFFKEDFEKNIKDLAVIISQIQRTVGARRDLEDILKDIDGQKKIVKSLA